MDATESRYFLAVEDVKLIAGQRLLSLVSAARRVLRLLQIVSKEELSTISTSKNQLRSLVRKSPI